MSLINFFPTILPPQAYLSRQRLQQLDPVSLAVFACGGFTFISMSYELQ
jgi:hypothetical protein